MANGAKTVCHDIAKGISKLFHRHHRRARRSHSSGLFGHYQVSRRSVEAETPRQLYKRKFFSAPYLVIDGSIHGNMGELLIFTRCSSSTTTGLTHVNHPQTMN